MLNTFLKRKLKLPKHKEYRKHQRQRYNKKLIVTTMKRNSTYIMNCYKNLYTWKRQPFPQ